MIFKYHNSISSPSSLLTFKHPLNLQITRQHFFCLLLQFACAKSKLVYSIAQFSFSMLLLFFNSLSYFLIQWADRRILKEYSVTILFLLNSVMKISSFFKTFYWNRSNWKIHSVFYGISILFNIQISFTFIVNLLEYDLDTNWRYCWMDFVKNKMKRSTY